MNVQAGRLQPDNSLPFFSNDVESGDTGSIFHFLRKEIEKEKILVVDLQYISGLLESWWEANKGAENLQFLKLGMAGFLIQNLAGEHLALLDKVGLQGHHISGLNLINTFQTPCPRLALVVHETLSDLCHLNDIKYPYEHHKTLCLRPAGDKAKEWGSGAGEITPHSDDLYETIDADYLSLTVCKDNTNTPTSCILAKEIIQSLDNRELNLLIQMNLQFISGKNVVGKRIVRIRPAVTFCHTFGFRFFLDFRIDDAAGMRMLAKTEAEMQVLDKLRRQLKHCQKQFAVSATGSFMIIANHKILHARSPLNIDQRTAEISSSSDECSKKERLLYRSKGSRRSSKFSEFCDLSIL